MKNVKIKFFGNFEKKKLKMEKSRVCTSKNGWVIALGMKKDNSSYTSYLFLCLQVIIQSKLHLFKVRSLDNSLKMKKNTKRPINAKGANANNPKNEFAQ